MNVCVVRDSSLEYFMKHIKPSLPKVDLVLFSFEVVDKIDYEKEVTAQTSFIKTILKLSEELNCLICLGCQFELLEEEYASILICEKGELLGIVDSASFKKKNKIKELKLFVTKLGNIGVLVNGDLLNEKLRAFMNKFEPRLIINIAKDVDIKTWNEELQKGKLETSFVSLTNHTLFYKEQESDEIKLNFCEFCTKELKI